MLQLVRMRQLLAIEAALIRLRGLERSAWEAQPGQLLQLSRIWYSQGYPPRVDASVRWERFWSRRCFSKQMQILPPFFWGGGGGAGALQVLPARSPLCRFQRIAEIFPGAPQLPNLAPTGALW